MYPTKLFSIRGKDQAFLVIVILMMGNLKLRSVDISFLVCIFLKLIEQARYQILERLQCRWERFISLCMLILEKRVLQGWVSERVAHHVSSAGDRVICVLPGDPPCHLTKVREVVKVMEQEMGLSPDWLWQRERSKVGMFKRRIFFHHFSTSFSLPSSV